MKIFSVTNRYLKVSPTALCS